MGTSHPTGGLLCSHLLGCHIRLQGSKLPPIQSHLHLNFFPLPLKYLEKSQTYLNMVLNTGTVALFRLFASFFKMQELWAHILFSKTADRKMQRKDYA